MTTRLPARAPGEDRLFLVVNAACKKADVAHLRASLPQLSIVTLDDRALLAMQGPKAADVVAGLVPGVGSLPFMGFAATTFEGAQIFVTRSGYTGEDGFEISLPPAAGVAFANALLADPRVKPIGLGARDSLRLEAGLCLYGHDIDQTTSPVEAGLSGRSGKRRRAEGGFPGLRPNRARTEGRPLAQARRPAARRHAARARGRARSPTRTARSSASSRRAASRRASIAPSPWATSPPRMPRPVRSSTRSCAASRCPRRSSPMPFVPPSLRPLRGSRHVHHPLHQGSRIHPHRRRHRRRSASPITRRRSWATWCSSNCRQPARRFSKGEQAAVVESVKAASEVYAPVSGEVVEVNTELEGAPAHRQRGCRPARAGS